jgi:hypothetical protein
MKHAKAEHGRPIKWINRCRGTTPYFIRSSRPDVHLESMKVMARRLLAAEATSRSEHDAHVYEAIRVYEKLRISLTRFAGPDGFTALMRRALVLARMEVPSLVVVNILSDGSIEGLVEISADSKEAGIESTVAITSNFLDLLVTFIGESLTLRLISDAWPDASLGNLISERETL